LTATHFLAQVVAVSREGGILTSPYRLEALEMRATVLVRSSTHARDTALNFAFMLFA
jgi:hypothetical protein